MNAVPLKWLLILPVGAGLFILLDVIRRKIEEDSERTEHSVAM
jgi:hypothetical protein